MLHRATPISGTTPNELGLETQTQSIPEKLVRLWFIDAVKSYPGQSLILVLLSLFTSIADGLSVSLLIPLLAAIFGLGEFDYRDSGELGPILDAFAQWTEPHDQFATVAGLILSLIVVRTILSHTEGVLASWISGRISCEIRSRIHHNLLHTEYEFLCINDNARLLNTLDGEAWSATEAITSVFGLFTSICMAAVFSGLLVLISWKLTLIVVLMLGGTLLLTALFDKASKSLSAKAVVAAEDLSERAVELFDAMRMTRAFSRESYSQSRYDEASTRLFTISMRGERLGALAGSVQEISHAATFVGTVFVALYLDIAGPALIAYLALLHRLQPHVRSIADARLLLTSLSAPIRAVAGLLSLSPWAPARRGTLNPKNLEREIRFERVSFSYSGKENEERRALEDVSLTLPVRSTTAIVGWSGAGKSTLVNLLYRFYDPTAGEILADGAPLTSLSLKGWREQLSIAGQDAELLGGTIRDNIAYGKLDASFDEIVHAAKNACAHEFISALPRGYDTNVGDHGTLLSGGQRQRIGLARALIKNTPVLILDEATNSLDSMTEAEVLRTLESLKGQATIILIAHRLSSTRTADQVVVLDRGRVAEVGTPDELYRRNGLYTRMVRLQELFNHLGRDGAAPEQQYQNG